jgi:hypothetical protein
MSSILRVSEANALEHAYRSRVFVDKILDCGRDLTVKTVAIWSF